MVSSVARSSVALFACFIGLWGCGGATEPQAPPLTATTTATVKNAKAQPAHDSQIGQLDEDQLVVLLSGRELKGNNPDGRRWIADFERSGNATVQWSGVEGPGIDTGSWRIEDDHVCMTWTIFMDGDERCMTIYAVGNDQYNLFNDNGSMNAVLSVVR